MMKHKIILSILATFLSVSAFSGPARKGIVHLSQPDGTTFSAKIRGDEFIRIVTTADGSSIIQDEEGWWCYAHYDAEGRKTSSGRHVGAKVPAEVISTSRHIPYEKLAAKAKLKRGSVQQDVEPLMKRIARRQGAATKGAAGGSVKKHGIIILAQYKDIKFRHSRDEFVAMLTKQGYNVNGATGSAKEYFDAQFNGTVEFSFDVSPIVTVSENRAYYGKNIDDADSAPEEMIIEACELADPDIDFSLYDDDGDGEVDNVFVFFAGGDEAEGAGEDCIWSHAWYIYSGAHRNLTLDGKRVDRYACTSELTRLYISADRYKDQLAGIGTFCHEYFHTFGIPDMYDTDYEGSGGNAAGLWFSTSLMDAGNQNNNGNTPPYLNAIEREFLGISEPVRIEANGGYELDPINKNGKYYRLDTDNEDEYYLLECRGNEGWDKYCGGVGMLVYHIDKSDRSTGFSDSYSKILTARERWNNYNEVNSRANRQCADLIEADSRKDSFSASQTESLYASADNIRSVFFPTSTVTSLLPDGKPALKFWSGNACEYSITNIQKTDAGVVFNVIGFAGTEAPPAVASLKTEAFTDAAIIQFESDRVYEGEAVVEWGKTGSDAKMERLSVKPYSPGRYSVTVEGLESNNKTYTVKVHFELDGLTGEEKKMSFMTKRAPDIDWPFIYMGSLLRNDDGSLPSGTKLPLRVYNASGAEISWEFNGAAITAEGDGYFTVTQSGVLKAHLMLKDGSEETIVKNIIIGKEEGK